MPTRNKHISPYLKGDFGTLLRSHRETKGFSQKEFADALEISVQRCNRYEKQGMTPDVELLVTMARMLHITVDELIGYEPIYDELNDARRLLDDAEIDFYPSDASGNDMYCVEYSDGQSSIMPSSALIRCTFEAQRQTNQMLRGCLDSLLISAYRSAFWQAYGWSLYKENFVNNSYIIEKIICHEKEFNKRLTYFRGKLGLTQTEFAKRLGITKIQTYNRYEKKGAQPSIPLLANMAYVLGISVHTLTGAKKLTFPERALDLLDSVGMHCSYKDGQYYLRRPVGILNKMDEDGQLGRTFKTESVRLKEPELYYYVSLAWHMIVETRFDLDIIYNSTFRKNFCCLAGSGHTPSSDVKADPVCCLYKKAWYEQPG